MKSFPIKYLFILLLFSTLLGSRPAFALFRGEEYTPRTHEITRLYFINVTSYEPSILLQDRFQQADNALLSAGGSMRSSDLYLFHHLRIQQDLDASFRFRAEYLRDRDFDGDFQRFELGMARQIHGPLWVEVLGQPTPNKEAADIGAALIMKGEQLNARLKLVRPLFWYEEKNPDDAEILKDPVNIVLDLHYLLGRSWEFFGRGDIDFTSEIENPTQSFHFRFRKVQAEAGIRWHICERSHIRAVVDMEQSQQRRTGLTPEDPFAFELDRDYLSAQLEWFRELPDEAHVRVGARYIHLDENQRHPYSELDSLHIDRQDRILYAARTWAVRNRIQLHMMALVDWADDQRITLDSQRFADEEHWLARMTGSVMFTGDNYVVETGAGLTIIDPRFGGGFIRLLMDL